MTVYVDRKLEFEEKARCVPLGSEAPRCVSCFHGVSSYIAGDNRCRACFVEDKVPAHVQDARQPKWGVPDPRGNTPAQNVKAADQAKLSPDEVLARTAKGTSALALKVICRILQAADAAVEGGKPFTFLPEALDALMRVAERCDMLADKTIASTSEPSK